MVIGGEAGQGLVTIGSLLAKCLVRQGYFIVVTQDYQSRIRGGHNSFMIRVSEEEIFSSQDGIDLLIALNAQSVVIHERNVLPEGTIVSGESADGEKILKVPYEDFADKRFLNTAALGVAASLLGIEESLVIDIIDETFRRKGEEVAKQNKLAVKKAYEWKLSHKVKFEGFSKPKKSEKRIMLNGNEAIALGAISAGLKFLSFYPMTPATSIALTVTKHALDMGIITEQAEDEIAAINMAIGASFAGAPSMVTTSGGGFALMVEGISLAAMTETPVVIVVAQRPGPATGLPTRTEQADLEFVLHSGHGEFPRAIFAPGDIEQCFHLTRKAFEIAEKYQSPVFILTDQFLADSYRTVEPFKDCHPYHDINSKSIQDKKYLRYEITDDGISPRKLPGESQDLVIADSDEHTEDGHLTEDLGIRKIMVEKRNRKGDGILADIVPPELCGEKNPDILLVTWGSTKGAALEATERLLEKGRKASVLFFPQLWPMDPQSYLPFLEGAGKIACVEGNSTGQLARLIRRESGFLIESKILRYDGLPITPEYIMNALSAELRWLQ